MEEFTKSTLDDTTQTKHSHCFDSRYTDAFECSCLLSIHCNNDDELLKCVVRRIVAHPVGMSIWRDCVHNIDLRSARPLNRNCFSPFPFDADSYLPEFFIFDFIFFSSPYSIDAKEHWFYGASSIFLHIQKK